MDMETENGNGNRTLYYRKPVATVVSFGIVHNNNINTPEKRISQYGRINKVPGTIKSVMRADGTN